MSSTSKRKLNMLINGKPYLVEVGSLHTSPIDVTVNGQAYQVELGEVDDGRPLARGSAAAVSAGADLGSTPPTPVAAHTVSGPSPKSRQVGALNKVIAAPMPGNIIDITVNPGDRVSVGQELCSLEAMKMRNVIRSSLAGVIATVEITKGQAVVHGDVLFTFA